MRIYTFKENEEGNIELSKEEFTKMLNEAYDDGYASGYAKGKAKDVVYWPVYPTYPTYPTYDKWTITTTNQPNTNPYRINSTGGVENVTGNNKQIRC